MLTCVFQFLPEIGFPVGDEDETRRRARVGIFSRGGRVSLRTAEDISTMDSYYHARCLSIVVDYASHALFRYVFSQSIFMATHSSFRASLATTRPSASSACSGRGTYSGETISSNPNRS